VAHPHRLGGQLHLIHVLAFRRFRHVSPELYEVVQHVWRFPSGQALPYVVRLHEDLRIDGVPCRAGERVLVDHDPFLCSIRSATLAEWFVARRSLCRRVECERDTFIAFDGVCRRAVAFTPVTSIMIRGLTLAAGCAVETGYMLRGTLGCEHRFGAVAVPAGATFEEDPDDFRTLHVTIAGTTIAVRR